jgi:glutathione S-transferase
MQHHPGRADLVPGDPALAREKRLRDRVYDFYVHEPMQKIVGDKLRPADKKDPYGVDQAKAQIEIAYRMLDEGMATRRWAAGDAFTMADCAAFPALYYANRVKPIDPSQKNLTAYLKRLSERPSVTRVLEEADPYFAMFPG